MRLKRLLHDYWFLFLIGAVIVAADQLSKAYVRANFEVGGKERWAPFEWMLPYARILYVENSGVAFGMFQGISIIFTILAISVALAIIYFFPRVAKDDTVLRVAMGLQLGGALGNLIDRLTQQGHVTDFISIGNFPVFNIADMSISFGVAILVISVWIQENKLEANTSKSDASAGSSLESEAPDQNIG